MRYLFFRKDISKPAMTDNNNMITSVNERYKFETFKPSLLHITPKDMNIKFVFVVYWILYLIIWKQQGKCYEHYLVYDEERLIHYSVVLPEFYRYPFMENNDIQIGPYWTSEQHRGQGICPFVILKILNRYMFRKKYAYIIIRENNIASQRSVGKCGLDFYGYGVRTKGFWGKFILKPDVNK